MIKRLVILAIFSIFIILPAYASIPAANILSGTVKINGTDAEAGTLIKAYISGMEKGSFTVVTAGQYGYLGITVPEEDNGKTITFKINNMIAEETASAQWSNGGMIDGSLNLSVIETSAPVATSNGPTATQTPVKNLNGPGAVLSLFSIILIFRMRGQKK